VTQDEIIDMAIQAGASPDENIWLMYAEELEVFYKLVAAKATAVEREACAKLAEEYGTWGGSGFYEWFKKLGAEIRARGEA
jgi:hypothetical protein